ncbi:MAG: serine--tRNA ligase [Elusimicrobia bacterium]|nr:serine--tRNA ligase [Elusimicrobiota bacterium]
MLDLKKLRENPEKLKELLAKRGIENPWGKDSNGLSLEKFFELDQTHKTLLQELEKLRERKKKLAEEFQALKKNGKETAQLVKETEILKKELKNIEEQFEQKDRLISDALLRIPNFVDASVPFGKSSEENVLVRQTDKTTEFSFPPKAHWELGEQLNILDFETAGKISGSRFALLKGAGAALERALISFMLDLHVKKHGYTEILAPYLVLPKALEGTGQLPKFEEELFKIERDNLYLIPTAEVSITNIHRDELFNELELPKKYVSYSACFRREAGSYGKDTKGLIRNHQFNKVELVWFTKPETSFQDLEKLTQDAEDVLKEIGIPYRVMALCSGDVGFASAKTYDLEVWMPGEKRWREISSCSSFTDFQARRMNIKIKTSLGKKEVAHTLNGSGVAVGRLFAAILENFQVSDGTILVPPVLKPYLGMECIKK